MKLRLLIFILIYGFSDFAIRAEPPRDRHGNPLPDGAIARLGDLRLKHEHPVLAAAFSPDGKVLASADINRAVVCWDPTTGKELRRLKVDLPGRLWGMRFSPDGQSLILVGDAGAFRVVDAVTGAEQRKLDSMDRTALLALDVSRDGKIAATIHYPGNVVVWDLPAGKRLREFKGPGNLRQPTGETIALTPDGKQLVLPHADGSLYLADAASGEEVFAFEMPPSRSGRPQPIIFQKVAISPDGRYLAYGSMHNAAAICDLKTGKRVREFSPPAAGIGGLAFSPNSRFLAVSGYTEVTLFGVLSGKQVRKLAKSPGAYSTLLLSPDGRMLAAFGPGPTNVAGSAIHLWDVVAERPAHPPVGHDSPVYSLAFSPDGKRLASAAHGELVYWDIAEGREIARTRTNLFPHTLGVAGDGETLQYLGSDWSFHRWTPESGHDESRRALPPMATNQPILSSDGRFAAAATFGAGQRIFVQDLKDAKTARTLTLPEKIWLTRMVFSPDGRRLAAATSDGALRLWDRDSGKLLREMPPDAPGGGAAQLALAGDARSVAVFDYQVRIREIASGGERLVIPQPGGVFVLTYSPDGRFLAWGQPDGGVVLRGTVTGKQLAHFSGGQGTVQSLAFSRDGRLLASGGGNGLVLVWKVPEGESLSAVLKEREADSCWQALADLDAARAGRALAELAAAPAQAVPLIKERFRAAHKRLSREEIARFVADLDADAFKVRERATRALAEAGPDAAEALRKALADSPSVEAKKRIEALLDRLSKGGDPEHLRGLRAIEILERIGTPQAADVLRELARKPLPADLEEEIRASLRRLDERR